MAGTFYRVSPSVALKLKLVLKILSCSGHQIHFALSLSEIKPYFISANT